MQSFLSAQIKLEQKFTDKMKVKMFKRTVILLLMVTGITFSTIAQNDDPILFTVEGNPVHLSEFNYIYSKTNGTNADFSEQSLQEYLDLYVKFKLKVKKARDMRLDTIKSLQTELDGYRRQLANSYLVDKNVTERLVDEAYERSQKDVSISHIMVALKPNDSPADTLKAYKSIMHVKSLLDKGQKFADLAKQYSNDKYSKDHGGKLGYVSALLPNGYYGLENAAYSTQKGKVSKPVRTAAGYHLVYVNDIREARGEIEAAHILIRKNPKVDNDPSKKILVDSLYTLLNAGAKFEDLAQQFSGDKASASKGGYIGFFGINKYQSSFEDAVFALTKDETYTKPVQTAVGWHIIKRISKEEVDPEKTKRRLRPRVKKDGRYQLAQNAMIKKIKKDGNFTENVKNRDAFFNKLDSTFLTHQWKADKGANEVLFTIGEDTKNSVRNFAAYCQRQARNRVRRGANNSPAEVANQLYKAYVDDQCIKYEESQLEVKYPEFKALMREYEEGILLFEATKLTVWDKASQDTTGLQKFHANNRAKYKWGERAQTTIYTVRAEAKDQMKSIRKLVKKNAAETVLAKFNTDKEKFIATQEKVIEKGKDEMLAKTSWKSGAVSESVSNPKNNSMKFAKIEKILPPAEKSLQEARGYIIADYQDFLEKKWLKDLKSSYKVDINQDVFKSIVK